MRFYSVVAGLYLSDKQKGIQTQHATGDMSVDPAAAMLYREWATNHKTTIVLNGFTSGGVRRAYAAMLDFVQRIRYYREFEQTPVALFCEDIESLDGAATASAIVVPEFIYAAKKVDNELGGYSDYLFFPEDGGPAVVLNEAETELHLFLRGFPLA
jgi:hypothetical protein